MRRLLTSALVFALACGGPTGPETSPTPEPPPPESPGEVNLNTESSSHPVVDDIEVTPRQPEWMAGNTVDIEAIAKDSTGARVDSFDVKWESLNPSVTAVASERDTLGSLDGMGLGKAVVAVWVESNGGHTVRHANAFVDEPLPADDDTPPSLDSLALSADTISPSDNLHVTVGASDAGAGVHRVIVGFRPAGEESAIFTYQTSYNESGTWHDGTWRAWVSADRLLDMNGPGTWEVSVVLYDRCDQPRTCPDDGSTHRVGLSPDDLRAAGWAPSFTVGR